jgi:excisionase family DNA binding protein
MTDDLAPPVYRVEFPPSMTDPNCCRPDSCGRIAAYQDFLSFFLARHSFSDVVYFCIYSQPLSKERPMTIPRSPPEPPVQLLTAKEVARRLKIAVRTVYRLTRAGLLPRPLRLTRKIVRWRDQDIDRHMRELEKESA